MRMLVAAGSTGEIGGCSKQRSSSRRAAHRPGRAAHRRAGGGLRCRRRRRWSRPRNPSRLQRCLPRHRPQICRRVRSRQPTLPDTTRCAARRHADDPHSWPPACLATQQLTLRRRLLSVGPATGSSLDERRARRANTGSLGRQRGTDAGRCSSSGTRSGTGTRSILTDDVAPSWRPCDGGRRRSGCACRG